jgi:hypothetical protein
MRLMTSFSLPRSRESTSPPSTWSAAETSVHCAVHRHHKKVTRLVAAKVMAPIVSCWPMTLEAVAAGVTVEVQPSRQQFIRFVAVR